MKPSEQPLYPKISSIYNKILQLAIAVALVALLINLAIFNSQQAEDTLAQHFDRFGSDLIAHSKTNVELLLRQKNRKQLVDFIENKIANEVISSVYLYSETGQLIAASDEKTINDLYGVNQHQRDISADYVPFVEALGRQGELGYLRFNITKSAVTKALATSQRNSQELLHLMMLLAGVVGFLLTRGLSRFSRQGLRPGAASSPDPTVVVAPRSESNAIKD